MSVLRKRPLLGGAGTGTGWGWSLRVSVRYLEMRWRMSGFSWLVGEVDVTGERVGEEREVCVGEAEMASGKGRSRGATWGESGEE